MGFVIILPMTYLRRIRTYDEFKQDHYKFIDKVVKICPKNGNLLFLAAATFKPDGVRDLIFEHGVDPNEKSTGGILPITKVLAKIYTSLIKKGMPLTRVQYETLKMLLDGGASPHIRDKEYKNAFDYVKRINNNKITKLVEKYRQQANNNFDANNNKNNTSQNNTTQTTNNGQTTNQGGGTRRKHRGRKAKKSRRHRHR
jgi:hypothetical protein